MIRGTLTPGQIKRKPYSELTDGWQHQPSNYPGGGDWGTNNTKKILGTKTSMKKRNDGNVRGVLV